MSKSTTVSATISATISAVSHPPSPPPPSSSSLSSSPTFRLLSNLTLPSKHPDLINHNNNSNSFEFNESDVVWSSSSSSLSDDVPEETPSPSNVSTSPPVHRRSNSGLFAALSDTDHLPSVIRKPAMSPSQSAATAARTIPPVTLRRSSEHYHQSAPVNVPVWPKSKANNGYLGRFDDVIADVAEEEDEEEEGGGGGGMVPPHEIVARSYVTFSVFEGAGRTLKGRDLCRVRNAVFRKTGFLD